MKILHVIRSTERATGGPAFAVIQMADALVEGGISVDIATTTSIRNEEAWTLETTSTVQDRFGCFCFPRQVDCNWSFSWQLWFWLKANVKHYDVLHITGAFTFPVLVAALEATRAGVPYIIRPAGTLDVYPLAQKAWRKKIYYRVFLKKILTNACTIHATSTPEYDQLSSLGIGGKTIVIPLAVKIPELVRTNRKADGLNIVFLSRIHPKKGLPVLFGSLSILKQRGVKCSLVIAGNGSAAYINELKHLIHDFEINDIVSFCGFVEGESKTRLLRQSDIFVLPSYQENFGIAVVEAMAAGLPVIVSEQVAISPEISESGAGSVVPIDRPGMLADAIQKFEDFDFRKKAEKKAVSLVESKFSSTALQQGLCSLYRAVINSYGERRG